MEQKPPKLMTPFDCLTTPRWLYTLKLMLPYTPSSIQHTLAVFIRFQEMRFTMEHFRNFPSSGTSADFLNSLKPYMEPSEQEMMEQMESMMNMMEVMQTMMPDDGQEIFDLYSNLFGSMKGDPQHE